MPTWLEPVGEHWLDVALAGLVLTVAAVLLMVLSRQPARRVVLARSALVGLIVLPLLVLAAPGHPSIVGAMPEAWRGSARRAGGALAVGSASVLAWALASTTVGLLGVRRLRRRSKPASATLEEIYREESGRRRRAPTLWVSTKVRGPALLGVFRGSIFLPPWLDEPEGASAARLGLRHELAHHDRGDPAFTALADLVWACWFFLPMAGWIRAQMRLDQEFLADRAAANEYAPLSSYASSLVALAEPVAPEPSRPSWRGRSNESAPLRFRVLMLVRSPFEVETAATPWCRVALACLLGVVTLLASQVPALGARWLGEASGSRSKPPAHGLVRVASLAIEPTRIGPDGRSRPYRLMTPLPPEFVLTARVFGTFDDLAGFRIVGQRLGPVPGAGSEPPDGFHLVRIVRDARGIRVEVDGRPVTSRAGGVELPGAALLSLQPPPGRSAKVQDLVLRW